MKNIFLLILPVVFSIAGLRAQVVPVPQDPVVPQQAEKGDTVIMKQGSVWILNVGVLTVVANEVMIGETKVKADGSVLFKDGTTDQLQEGDMILPSGALKRAVIKAKMDTNPSRQPDPKL